MDLTFDLFSPTYSRKSIQQLSHLYSVSAIASENRYIISHLRKRNDLWAHISLQLHEAPLLCSHFISWKSCLYMIMPLLPFFQSPLSHFLEIAFVLSNLPITSVFPNSMIISVLTKPMQQHLTQLLPLNRFSWHGFQNATFWVLLHWSLLFYLLQNLLLIGQSLDFY